MPEGIPYSGANSPVSTGKELSVVGKHCYAYSGLIATGASYATYLEFTTGSKYIKGIMQIDSDWFSQLNNEFSIKISLDGVGIIEEATTGLKDYKSMEIYWYNLVLPPYTTCKVEIFCAGAANANANFTGKLH